MTAPEPAVPAESPSQASFDFLEPDERRAKRRAEEKAREKARDRARRAAGVPRAPRPIDNGSHEAAKREVERMARAADFAEAAPRHWVALYDVLHEKLYGVEAVDLTPVCRTRAAAMAGQILRRFGWDPGDPSARRAAGHRMFAYAEWAWKREAKHEAFRRQNPHRTGSGRLTWQSFFGGKSLGDFAADLVRKRG